jgi:hypothetical protein
MEFPWGNKVVFRGYRGVLRVLDAVLRDRQELLTGVLERGTRVGCSRGCSRGTIERSREPHGTACPSPHGVLAGYSPRAHRGPPWGTLAAALPPWRKPARAAEWTARKQFTHISGNGPKSEWVQVGTKARRRRRVDGTNASARLRRPAAPLFSLEHATTHTHTRTRTRTRTHVRTRAHTLRTHAAHTHTHTQLRARTARTHVDRPGV